ncbi:hypothetical protein BDN70DRAFT_932437 [Pholiota conissans]|uniref:DUF7918 domain-containing protein n=1 Tax=Pholiota conissans TaxID=109636 RepID=A0A9P5Z1D4_9AGAR|nr:hypothetical protein BDN70DRAFT_932437 [Pholiota conissans]
MESKKQKELQIPNPWLHYRGYEACILVENHAVPCFCPENKDDKNEAVAWIPSEANKTFAVYYRKTLPDDHNDYCMTLYLDGKKVACAVVRKESGLKLYRVASIHVSPTETRDFMFNNASLTDDDTFLDAALSTGIGEIRVMFQPVNVTKETKPPEESYTTPSDVEKFHERLKAGLNHQVGYNSNKTRSSTVPSRWLLYDLIGNATTLTFKYRSIDALQANGIAHRIKAAPSSPVFEAKDESSFTASSQRKVSSEATKNRDRHISSEIEEDYFRQQIKPKAEEKIPEEAIIKIKCEEKVGLIAAPSEDRTYCEDSSNEEDTDQIVIDSLRTLLVKLEKAASKKRARKDATHANPTKKSRSVPAAGTLTSSEYASSLHEIVTIKEKRRKIPPIRTKETKGVSIPADAEVIDLT